MGSLDKYKADVSKKLGMSHQPSGTGSVSSKTGSSLDKYKDQVNRNFAGKSVSSQPVRTYSTIQAEMEHAKRQRDNYSAKAAQRAASSAALYSTMGTSGAAAWAANLADDEDDKKAAAWDAEYNRLRAELYSMENDKTLSKLGKDTNAQTSYTAGKQAQSDAKRLQKAVLNSFGQFNQYPYAQLPKDDSYSVSDEMDYLEQKYGTRDVIALYARIKEQENKVASDLEKAGYNYDRLTDYEQRLQDAAVREQQKKTNQKLADEHAVRSSVSTIPIGMLQGADYLSIAGQTIANEMRGEDDWRPVNTDKLHATNYVTDVRGRVGENIEKNTDWTIGGQNVARFLYDTAMSMGDSTATIMLGGPAASVLLGGAAASQTAIDVLENGGTAAQATMSGLAAGAAEAVFEKFSVDNLIRNRNVSSVKRLVTETLKQSGVEGSEEMATEIANILTNAVIMGEESDINQMVGFYMSEQGGGLSEEQAKKQTFRDLIKQVAWAGAGGALSGGVMGGGVNTMNLAANAAYARQMYGEDPEALISQTLAADAGNKLAKKLQERNKAKQDISGLQLSTLNEQRLRAFEKQQKAQEKSGEHKLTIEAASQKYGKQAEAMKATYTSEQNVKQFDKAFGAMHSMAKLGIAYDIAVEEESVQYLTDDQKKLAYNTGRDADGAIELADEVSEYEISAAGKTVQKSTDKAVELGEVVSVNGGTMTFALSDGSEAVSTDLSYATEDEAMLYSAVNYAANTAAEANAMISGYRSSGMSAEAYSAGIRHAFNYGRHQMPKAQMMSIPEVKQLPADVRNAAFAAGKNLRAHRTGQQQADVELSRKTGKKADKVGQVLWMGSQATKNTAEDGSEVQFSIRRTQSMSLKKQLSAFYNNEFKQSDSFYFGETPSVLYDSGLEALPLAFGQEDFLKSTKKKHNVPRRVLNNLHEKLSNPIFTFTAGKQVVAMIDDIDGDGKPIVVAIHGGHTMDRKPINVIKSIYGLEDVHEWVGQQIKGGSKFRVYDIEKANAILQTHGYLAAVGERSVGSWDKITETEEPVNRKNSFRNTTNGTRQVQTFREHQTQNGRKLTEVQEASIFGMERLAALMGVDMYVYESYVNDKGKRMYKDDAGHEYDAPNGYYQDGHVYIDLNAGDYGEGSMLFTVSHELTHFIKEWSPAKYDILCEILMDGYAREGISVDRLVRQQQLKAIKNGRELSYEAALEEVVADSMESMLADGSVVQMMAELKQRDKSLWEKIRDFFADLLDDLKAMVDAYKGYKPNSKEGKMVAEMQDVIDKIQPIFAEALLDAGAAYQTTTKNTTEDGGVKYQAKNRALTDSDLEPYMRTGKTLHTRNKKLRMLESGKKPILTSPAEIRDFMRDVIYGKALGEVRAFGVVGTNLADEIVKYYKDRYLAGDYLEFNADNLREAFKRHSIAKQSGDIPLTESDFENIPDYINEFDGVLSVDSYNNRIEIQLYKETEDGYIKILTISSKERSALQVVKLIGNSKEKFESKYAKKIERSAGSPRGQTELSEASNPSTKARLTAGALSDTSISDEKQNSNRKNSFRNATAIDGVEQAEQMERNGSSRQKIWYELGLIRDAAGNWVTEIDDSNAKFYAAGDARLQNNPDWIRYKELEGKMINRTITDEEHREMQELSNVVRVLRRGSTLQDYLSHDELYRAAPYLKDVPFRMEIMGGNIKGMYNKSGIAIDNGQSADERLSTTMHEAQHAIQDAEGRPGGANPEYWQKRMYNGEIIRKNDKKIAAARNRRDAAWDKMPERLKSKVREINRESIAAKESGNYDRLTELQNELFNSEDADLYAEYDNALWEERLYAEYNEPLSAQNLYYQTAGEIEARLVQQRRNMTDEQRRARMPDFQWDDAVFAEQKNTAHDSGVKYSDRNNTAGMTDSDIRAVQSIGRKSVNQFASLDIQATERFARQYWKEMGIKSPFFRAWFGDWRANDKTPVQIANQQGDARGVQHNDDTGWNINVSAKVFSETRNHKASSNLAARKYLPYINDIVKKAVFLDSYGIGTGKTKSPNSLLMHSLYAVADVGDGPVLLKLYVEEMNDPNGTATTKRAYQLQNIEISSPTGSQGTIGSGNALASLQTANIKNVADLFSYVKQQDAEFKPNPASKVVNPDGTPMVVNHGTDKDFTVFQSKNGRYWFSESEDYAESMAEERNGKVVMHAYLNMRRPYRAKLPPGQFSDPNYEAPIIYAAKAGNYDGVIIEVDTQNEIEMDTFYVVFDNTQIKSATDNVGTFDVQNPDIRFSDRNRKSAAALERENKRLKEDVKYLRELVRLQKKVTGGTKMKRADVEHMAKLLMKNNDIRGNHRELVPMLTELYEFMAANENIEIDAIREKAQPAVDWMMDHVRKNTRLDPYAEEILSVLKSSSVRFNESQKAEAASLMDGWGKYRNSIIGAVGVSDKSSTTLDQLWADLAQSYPSAFDADIPDSRQPAALLEIIEDLRGMKHENYDFDTAMLEQAFLQEVYDGYWRVSTLDTVADMYQKRIDELKAMHFEEMEKAKAALTRQMDLQEAAYQQFMDETIAAERAQVKQQKEEYSADRRKAVEKRKKTARKKSIQKTAKKLDTLLNRGTKENNIKEGMQEFVSHALTAANTIMQTDSELDYIRFGVAVDLTAREQKVYDEARELLAEIDAYWDIEDAYDNYDAIKKTVNGLERRLRELKDLHGREIAARKKAGMEVPEDFSVVDMIKEPIHCFISNREAQIAQDAKEQLQKLYQLKPSEVGTYTRMKQLESRLNYRMKLLTDVFERERTRRDKTTVNAVLNELALTYKALEDATGYLSGAYDEEVYGYLNSLSDKIGKVNVKDMDLYQLECIDEAFTMVYTVVNNVNQAFTDERKRGISEMGEAAMAELNRQKQIADTETGIGRVLKRFHWNNMKPVYAFERIGSEVLKERFDAVRKGEDVYARDVTEARQVYLQLAQKYGADDWNLEERFEFEDSHGKKFKLDRNQMMSIYAYSRRDQAIDHFMKGGVVIDPNTDIKGEKIYGIPVDLKPTTANTYHIGVETLQQISQTLTENQRLFAQEMQDYLSDELAAKGNEVSVKMYGVKLFKEKHYFPLRSASQYNAKAKDQQEAGEAASPARLKNRGMTKAVTPGANNPIILSGFMETWSGHVDEMSMYHSFVLPLEDFIRVYNYNTPAIDTDEVKSDAKSVDAILQNTHGAAATQYVAQLVNDLNSGARMDSRENMMSSLVAKWKLSSVGASLSVVIQQPSSVARAFALIDPKYFDASAFFTFGDNHKEAWNELKRYAPVAIIKEMGYFDTNMGRSTADFLVGKDYDLKKWQPEAIKDEQYRDELMSRLPALADEKTWCTIWGAVKREQAALDPNADINSDYFLEKCGERFTEVISKTQVYDSVLARSANMRSKSMYMNMLTSFMAEPTTAINMVENAFYQWKVNGDSRAGERQIGAVVTSVLLNSMLVSLVYAMRDDDEDETFAEKYLSRLASETFDGLNPLTYLPIVKDIYSLFQGYDIERADMALFSDLAESVNNLGKPLAKDTSDMDEKEFAAHWASIRDQGWGFVDFGFAMAGVPFKNVRREFKGIFNLFDTLKKDFTERDTSAMSLKDAVWEEWKGNIPILGMMPDAAKSDKLFDATIAGDTAYLKRLNASYDTESARNYALRKGLRDNDPRIKEAAALYVAAEMTGDYSAYNDLKNKIIGENKFSQNNILAAIEAEVKKLLPEEDAAESVEKAKAAYDEYNYVNALAHGKSGSAQIIRDEVINTYVLNGDTREAAESKFVSITRSAVKYEYLDGKLGDDEAIDLLITYGGVLESKAVNKVRAYRWMREHPEYDLSESEVIGYTAPVEGLGLSLEDCGISPNVYAEYVALKSWCKGVDSNGDGKADRNSVKNEVLAMIDQLPISNSQKDALYLLNGWAKSGLRKAPWR